MNNNICFIIASHGELANGFKDSLLFFNNSLIIETVIQDQYSSNFEESLEKIIQKSNQPIVIFTDLKGGSVNQIATKLLKKYDFHLISGANLALMLELSFKDEIDEETIKLAMNNASYDVCYINELLKEMGD